MRTISHAKLRPYGVVTLSTGTLVVFCQIMEKWGVGRGYGATFWVVVVGASVYYGLWPGLYAALVSSLTFDYFFIPPTYEVGLTAPLILIALCMLIVAVMAGRPVVAPHAYLWEPQDSGDDWSDTAHGEGQATAFLGRRRQSQADHELCLIVRDMVRLGHFGPAEIGFIHRIAEGLEKPQSIRVITAHDDAQDLDLEPGVIEVQYDVVGPAVGDDKPRL
jgi:hypothetical protein